MATWNLLTEAFPIFASKNYISQDSIDYGTLTASEMQALASRIIDGDPFSYWQGSTAADATEVTLTFSLNEGSSLIARSPDILIFQNINWKNFVGEWSVDGSAWTAIASLAYASGVANNVLTDLIVNPADIVNGKYLRFRITHTIVASEKKKCGGIIACLGVVQPAGGFIDYKASYRESVREVELGDRTISREYVMRSGASYEFWGAAFTLPIVTAAELLLLRGIKRDGLPFVLILEPGFNKREAYLCHFDGPWRHEYENPIRSVGYNIGVKVKEVGSH